MLPGILLPRRAETARRGRRAGLRRLLLPALLLFGCACGSADSAGSENSADDAAQRLLEVRWERFRLLEVSREGPAVRCDVAVLEAPSSESELRRLTYNIAGEIQAFLGRDRHLAIWVYDEDDELLGVAFHSPLTESFQFRTKRELEESEAP